MARSAADPMHQYLVDDFPAYAKCFSKHATAIVELMRILEEKFKADLEIQTYRPKDLFRMTTEMLYQVNETYEKEKGIEKEPLSIKPFMYMDSDETWNKMQDLIKSELAEYFNAKSNE